jgi:ubiquitin C-terminal hydrolase
MFGLNNYSGSCWVNATLQAIFRFPFVQDRYSSKTFDKGNVIDECLMNIWNSKGTQGLGQFFEAVRTDTMPAGQGIGDSHELLQYLCDKLPYLDKLCRFKIAHSMECTTCKKKTLTRDSVIDFSLDSVEGQHVPLSTCISKTVEPYPIQEWECETCKNKGGIRQQLIGSFPDYMMFHLPISQTTVDYSSILVLNGKKYALMSVICFNGGHWWTYARNMPPGSSWYMLDDTNVSDHGPKQFPISGSMRVLIYYRLEE